MNAGYLKALRAANVAERRRDQLALQETVRLMGSNPERSHGTSFTYGPMVLQFVSAENPRINSPAQWRVALKHNGYNLWGHALVSNLEEIGEALLLIAEENGVKLPTKEGEEFEDD